MKKMYLIAGLLAVVTGILLWVYLSDTPKQDEPRKEYDTVVVAVKDIPGNVKITAEMVTLRQLPKGTAHEKSTGDVQSVVGKMTSSAILAGEQLLPSKLIGLDAGAGTLAGIIPKGMRAITVAVNDITGVAGFVQKGNRVDIVVTTAAQNIPKDGGKEKSGTATYCLMENIQVIGIDKSIQTGVAGGQTNEQASGQSAEQAATYTMFTLLVTPQQALELVHARDLLGSQLTFLLRRVDDTSKAGADPVLNFDLSKRAA